MLTVRTLFQASKEKREQTSMRKQKNKKLLTEEMPETPKDLKQRQLSEIEQCARPKKRLLTEDLPQEEEEDDGD
jgi:hypothetical protein